MNFDTSAADDVRLHHARVYLQAGRAGDAAQLTSQVLAQHPDDPDAMYVLAVALVDGGDITGGLRCAERLAALRPGDPDTWMLLAKMQVVSRLWDAAVESAEHARRLAPGQWGTHLAVASALRERGVELKRRKDLRRALSEADIATRMAPDVPDTHLERGHALLELRRRQQAVAAYRDALRIDPGNEIARTGLGAVDIKSFRFLRAANTFTQMLRESPHDSETWRNFLGTVVSGMVFVTAIGTIALGLSLRLLYMSYGYDTSVPTTRGQGTIAAAVVVVGLVIMAGYAARLWLAYGARVITFMRRFRIVVAWMCLTLASQLAALVLYLTMAPYAVVLQVVGPCHLATLVLCLVMPSNVRRLVDGKPYVSPEAHAWRTWEAGRQLRLLRRTAITTGVLIALFAGLEFLLQTYAPGYLPSCRWCALAAGGGTVLVAGCLIMAVMALGIVRLHRLGR